MKRLTKRGLIIGIAGLMMVVGIGASSSVSANTSCLGSDTAYCNSELRTYNYSGFINPNIAGDFGQEATNIAPTLGQQRAFDSLVINSGDRVRTS
jgi:spermidine/putrescine-binding protein